MKEKTYALLDVCYITADILRYLDYLFEEAFSGMTQVKTKDAQRMPAVRLK